MLITREKIQDRFSQNLEWATEIDLASAWASPNRGLCALRRQFPRPEVRAIVGLSDNITDPDALRELADMGELRVFPEAGERRLFHPKVYIFRGSGRSVAWIGSANFTCPGFGGTEKVLGHEEVLFETSDTKAVERWFNQLRKRCTRLDKVAITFYADHRTKHRPAQRSKTWDPASLDESPPVWLLNEVDDWRSYVEALKRCDQWWNRWSRKHHPKNPWSVLGKPNSWRETIQGLQEIVHKDWRDELSGDERSHLRGLGGAQWALLGDLRRVPEERLFGSNRKKIQEILYGVAFNNAASLDEAIRAYKSLTDKKDGKALVGPATATRLLALAKPDRFVSLNGGSRKWLARCFGPNTPTALKTPKNYRSLLEKIYDQTWFREPDPRDELEHEICSMRAALLDCFVYEDMGNK